MKKHLLLLILCSLFVAAHAQHDLLEPETGFFSGYDHQDAYYPRVKKTLMEGLPNNTEARIVVMPSFFEEYLISIDNSNLTYRIAKSQISGNKTTDPITYTEHKMRLPRALASSIHELIFTATSRAQYPPIQETTGANGAKFIQSTIGFDGTVYIFVAFEGGFGLRSGTTWSPRTEKLRTLVEIVDWLVASAKTGTLENQEQMQLKIDELRERFKIESEKP